MSEKDGTLKKSFKGRSWTRPEHGGHRTETVTGSDKDQCAGIERGNRFVRRFQLFLRDGCIISIPYAHLPVILYDPDESLRIKTGEMEITVTGRGLDTLAGWLNEEKLLWIRESASGTDTCEGGVFISGISLDGELFE